MRPAARWSAVPSGVLAGAALVGLVLLLFGDLLLSHDAFVSNWLGDTARYLVHARRFGFEELRAGNLALWNPHTFSGTPFLGVFQSSLLYPPSSLALLLPLTTALNTEFALHVLLLGCGAFAWLRGQGLRPWAAIYAASVLMLGGTFFLRVQAGALTVLGVLAWSPLLLLCIDRLVERASLGWCLVGILVTTLMILAGHPPTVLMAGLVAGSYAAALLWGRPWRWRVAGALGLVAIAPLFLSAAQLWTGLQVASESIRAGGISYEQATSYSLPPENLLALVAPGFFGNASLAGFWYWGRWIYWDDTVFLGVTSLALLVHGASGGRHPRRGLAITLTLLFALLALGRYTPLYGLLFHFVPGFDLLRAPSKFAFFASLFGALLVGLGVQRLLAGAEGVRGLAVGVVAAALVLGTLALWIHATSPMAGSDAAVPSPLFLLSQLEDARRFDARKFARFAGDALRALGLAVATGLALAVLLVARRRSALAAALVLALGLAELLVFARSHRDQFRLAQLEKPGMREAYARAGESRVLEADRASNLALALGGYGIWGYDPVVLERTARFVAFTQGRDVGDLDNVGGDPPDRPHPLLGLVRCRLLLRRDGEIQDCAEDPLPHMLLVREFRVRRGADEVLAALAEPGFDPRRTVVLEQEPQPRPDPTGSGGSIRLLDESTDHLTLEVSLAEPAILLVTDAYAEGWRVEALAGPQDELEVLPADLVLRAVPLGAGRHRLRMEYAPTAFHAGVLASLASSGVFVAAAGVWAWRRLARSRRQPPGAAADAT